MNAPRAHLVEDDFPPPVHGSFRAWVDSAGHLKIQTPDGQLLRAGRVTGRPGKDGRDGGGLAGVEFVEGKDGVSMKLRLADGREVISPALKHGEPGSDGVGLRGIRRVGNKLVADLSDGRSVDAGFVADGLNGRPGTHGKDGDAGPPGPLPRHQWDGTKVHFEQSRQPDGEPVWGPWADLRGPQGKNRTGGGSGGFEAIPRLGVDDWTMRQITVSRDARVEPQYNLYLVNAAAGDVTITLLPPALRKPGPLIIKKINTTGGDVYVVPHDPTRETIEYDTSMKISGVCRPAVTLLTVQGGYIVGQIGAV